MEAAESWRDVSTREKNRIILTEKELHIPGLRMFGHHLSYNATASLNWHYHENAFEFSMPAQGTFTFSTRQKGPAPTKSPSRSARQEDQALLPPQETLPFSGGEVFVSRPNEVHGTNRRPINGGELYWFQLDTTGKDLLFLSPKAGRALKHSLLAIPGHVVKTDIKKTLPLLEQAFSRALAGEDPYFTAALLQYFLHLTVQYSRQESSPVSPDIQAALTFIRENLTKELPLELLAETAMLSCSQFKQKFKKQLGVSPRHYVNQQKIEYAKSLLAQGRSVTETAMLLNFSDSSYFSTVFKKYTLFTPREYRAMMRDSRLPLE